MGKRQGEGLGRGRGMRGGQTTAVPEPLWIRLLRSMRNLEAAGEGAHPTVPPVAATVPGHPGSGRVPLFRVRRGGRPWPPGFAPRALVSCPYGRPSLATRDRARCPCFAPVGAAVPGHPGSGRVPNRWREATEGLPYTGFDGRCAFVAVASMRPTSPLSTLHPPPPSASSAPGV